VLLPIRSTRMSSFAVRRAARVGVSNSGTCTERDQLGGADADDIHVGRSGQVAAHGLRVPCATADQPSDTGVRASSSTYLAGIPLARAASTIGSRYDRVGIIESSIRSARAT
jgi:hypothetical protein